MQLLIWKDSQHLNFYGSTFRTRIHQTSAQIVKINLLILLIWLLLLPHSDRNIEQTLPRFTVLSLTTPHFFLTVRQLRYLACSALGADSSCGSPGEGTCVITWHVNQHCMATIRIHQIPESTKQTGEVVIRGAALRLIHLFGGGEVWSPSRFSSDFPLCHFSVA